MKTIWTIGITLVVVGGLMGVGYKLSNRFGSAAPQDATPVRVETVQKGDLIELVSAPGQLQAKNKVSISAKVSARIVALPFDEGAAVKQGQTIIQLDSKDLEAQLKAAEARHRAQGAEIEVGEARLGAQQAQIESAKVQLADAERDLRRQLELLGTKDISQSVVDQAQAKADQFKAQLNAAVSSLAAEKANLSVQRHQLEAAEAEIARARDNLSYTTITSPIDGTVIRLNAKVGELVVTGTMNNAGTVIMEVADLSQMLVNTRVDEANVSAVEIGQKAAVRLQAYPDQQFEGTVQTIGLANIEAPGQSLLSQQSTDMAKTYKVEILLKNAGRRVFSGLTADVDIETRKHHDVIRIPSQAVMGREIDSLPTAIRDKPEIDKSKTSATVVYRFDGGKAITVPVKVGPSDNTHTVIEAGLNVGDRIIVGPYSALEKLKHDQSVKEEGK